MTQETKPLLVTFDGEARSGKGTIVQATKDFLRDERGYKTMLIDRGQTFRVLVVAAERAGIDLDNPDAIDNYLEDESNITSCMQLVKDVYHMTKDERDALLYRNKVGVDSAKVGARPASQAFVKMLTKKWMRDAGAEGYEVVLVDGRALETVAREMDAEGLCDYRMGLYFICDAIVGARRTLGYAKTPYEELQDDARSEVDTLVEQIKVRNYRDSNDRANDEDRLLPPTNAQTYCLPNVPPAESTASVPMYILDTSADLTKNAMSLPVAEFVANVLH
jgi:cytidylate kinase